MNWRDAVEGSQKIVKRFCVVETRNIYAISPLFLYKNVAVVDTLQRFRVVSKITIAIHEL